MQLRGNEASAANPVGHCICGRAQAGARGRWGTVASRAMRSIVAIGFAILLTACSSGGSATPQAPGMAPSASASRRTGKLVLRIHVPRKARRRRVLVVRDGKPAYISPATLGMTLAITGPTNLSETIGLTPASPGCSGAGGGTSCSLTLSGLVPCTGSSSCYTATVATYDAVSCTPACSIPRGANELSAARTCHSL